MDWTNIVTIIWLIVLIILLLIFISIPLYLTARWLDEEEGFLRAVGTTILLIASFLLCLIFIPYVIPYPIVGLIIAVLINLVIIKYSYDAEWGKAFAMWIVTVVIAVLLLILVSFLGLGLLALTS